MFVIHCSYFINRLAHISCKVEGAFSCYYRLSVYIIYWQEQIRLVVQQVAFWHKVLMLRWMQYPHPSPIGATAHRRPGPSHYRGFTNPLRHISAGRTSLDEWSALPSDLYLGFTTLSRHRLPCPRRDMNPLSQQPSCPRPMALERAATRTGVNGAGTIGLTYHCYNCFMECHPRTNLQPLLLRFGPKDRPYTDGEGRIF